MLHKKIIFRLGAWVVIGKGSFVQGNEKWGTCPLSKPQIAIGTTFKSKRRIDSGIKDSC